MQRDNKQNQRGAEMKPITTTEFDIITDYQREIEIYRGQIKDLKLTIERLNKKLKKCSDCEMKVNKWAIVTIREIAKIIHNCNCNPVYEAKKIIDKCDEVLK